MAHELTPHEPDGDDPFAIEPARPSRARRLAVAAIAVVVAVTMVAQLWPDPGIEPAPVAAAADDDPETVTILAGAPASIDPAKHGDLGSASYVTQLFETLTAVDPSLAVRPALAESWSVEEGGTRVVFTLRDGLTFSDGSSLTATDVVRSWRRLFDPREPSPLASLIADVKGARALLNGETDDVSTLGVRADGDRRVIVDLERGGSDLPAIVSGRAVRDRAAVGRRRRDPAHGRQLRRQRWLPRQGGHRRRVRARGQPVVLGGRTGHQDRPHAHQPRRQQPGRRVRRGRHRRRPDLVHGRGLDRVRPRPRAVPAERPVAVGRRTTASTPARSRSTTRASAARSPRRSTGAASRRSTSSAPRSRPRASSRPGSPGARTATSCRRTTRPPPVRCSRRPATRPGPRSARSRSSPAAAATTAR